MQNMFNRLLAGGSYRLPLLFLAILLAGSCSTTLRENGDSYELADIINVPSVYSRAFIRACVKPNTSYSFECEKYHPPFDATYISDSDINGYASDVVKSLKNLSGSWLSLTREKTLNNATDFINNRIGALKGPQPRLSKEGVDLYFATLAALNHLQSVRIVEFVEPYFDDTLKIFFESDFVKKITISTGEEIRLAVVGGRYIDLESNKSVTVNEDPISGVVLITGKEAGDSFLVFVGEHGSILVKVMVNP